MKLPKLLKRFSVTFGVSDFSAICDEVALPKLKFKTEEWRGGGMDGPIEMPTGIEKLEATFKFGEQTIEGYLAAGVSLAGFMTVTVRGEISSPEGESDTIIAILRGWVKTVDPGTMKPGDPKSSNQTIEMAVSSYFLTRGAVPLIAIEIKNGKTFIGPFDQMEAARKNLKIG
jgi:P2 family phage contractile tail tube protein